MLRRCGILGLVFLGVTVLLCGWRVTVRAGEALPPNTSAGPCKPWVQVNDGGFGLESGGDYVSEEGFEVIVFDGQLYVGMEADNEMGARLWRTRAGVMIPRGQRDWEEVAADALGHPFGLEATAQNDHIDSLAVFEGKLYASTANRSGTISGTLLYSSATGAPNSWTQVISPGFGDANNVNFKDMLTFTTADRAWLCGGTANDGGAEVWCSSDGSTWEQKSANGFGVMSNTLIASTGVFSGALYVGVANGESRGSVWRTFDLLTWSPVFTAPHHSRVEVAGVLSDALYIVAGAYDGRYDTDPTLQLYRSRTGDPGSWQALNTPLDDDAHNTRTVVDGATVYNGALYVATMNAQTGTEVWRTPGAGTWSQVNGDGFGTTKTFAAELIPFNGYLYAWVSNYETGQQVWRSACPIEQRILPLTNTSYALPGVGAILTFTEGAANVDVLTVSVYPGAYPVVQMEALPVARMYEITHTPPSAVFTVDLALSYTAEELEDSGATSPALSLTRWDTVDHDWVTCAVTETVHSLEGHIVTCRDLTAFSTWSFSNTIKMPQTGGTVYLPLITVNPGYESR